MNTLTILKAARLRIETGTFAPTECVCAMNRGITGPVPPTGIWCALCAIEASQITGGFPPEQCGAAIAALVEDIAGRAFASWIDRFYFMMDWMATIEKDGALAEFARTIARLEKADA